MVYGYVRRSTAGQSLEAQIDMLQKAGAEKIFSDVFTGTKNDRPKLDKLLKIIKEGDKLIVTKLDRIARSLVHGIQLIEGLSIWE